jgi:hypothetical protein
MRKTVPKRPIDLLRDSAKSMRIGDGDDDDSAISGMIPIGETLYMIKGHSIYAVQLADQLQAEAFASKIHNSASRKCLER